MASSKKPPFGKPPVSKPAVAPPSQPASPAPVVPPAVKTSAAPLASPKPAEAKPVIATKAIETKAAESKPVPPAFKPAEAKPVADKPVEPKTLEAKPVAAPVPPPAPVVAVKSAPVPEAPKVVPTPAPAAAKPVPPAPKLAAPAPKPPAPVAKPAVPAAKAELPPAVKPAVAASVDVLKPVAVLQENVRATTEKAITAFRGQYAEVKGIAETATSKLEDSVKAAQEGSRAMGVKLLEIAKAQTHAHLDHAKTLASAKSLPEFVSAQQSFLVAQVELAQSRGRDVVTLAGQVANDVTAPLRASLNLLLRR